MNRQHCDNCDVVITGDLPSQRLTVVMKNGDYVDVETIIVQPVTRRRLELCMLCHLDLIASAKQRHP